MSNTQEGLESAHKKAVKSLDGEKRAAIKKAKGTKGKKAKEALAQVEEEYTTKLKDLETKHQQQLQELVAVDGGGGGGDDDAPAAAPEEPTDTTTAIPPEAAPKDSIEDEEEELNPELSAKERKQEKARRKKERQKEKEAQKQKELEEEMANAGPSMRKFELDQIQSVLTPLNMKVAEVEADGHCLFRAVAAQTGRDNYTEVRALCADTLQAHSDDFAPFCEYTDTVANFDQYVDRVRNTAEWGGHLELRALSMALDLPIHVYSLQSGSTPLCIDGGNHNDETTSDMAKDPVCLSYHLHYYALGEHYNRVVPQKEDE